MDVKKNYAHFMCMQMIKLVHECVDEAQQKTAINSGLRNEFHQKLIINKLSKN